MSNENLNYDFEVAHELWADQVDEVADEIAQMSVGPAIVALRYAIAAVSAATGYPDTHYGGVEWAPGSYTGTLAIALPGDGMKGRAWANRAELEICSLGDIVRAKVVIRPNPNGAGVMTEVSEAFEPRRRDLARARMWARIAEGVLPRLAAQAEGLGNNIGHAHAGSPAEVGEESAFDTAVKLLRLRSPLVRNDEQVLLEAGRRAVWPS